MISLIGSRIDEIRTLCKDHKVRSIALFGSAANGRMNDDSDVDILVEFGPDLRLLDYADNYFSLLEGLENIFGKKVDLISKRALKNPILKAEIERSKIDLYAA